MSASQIAPGILPVRGIQPERMLANGRMATADGVQELAKTINLCGSRLQRVLYSMCMSHTAVTGSASSGVTGNFYTVFRTSPTQHRVHVRMVGLHAATTATTDSPSLYWRTQPLNGLATNQRTLYVPSRSTSPTDDPDEFWVMDQYWVLEPDTIYAADLVLNEYARVFSVTIWEEPPSRILVDNERSKRGAGDSFSITGTTVTLTDSGATFEASDVGRKIYIAGATTNLNNGLFEIASVPSSTTLTYSNPSGATEAFSGKWRIGEPYLNPKRYEVSSEITDADIWDLWDVAEMYWKRGGGVIGNWWRQTPVTTTSATAVHMFDGGAGFSSTTTRTFKWSPYKKGSYNAETVPVFFWVEAAVSGGGTGTLTFNYPGGPATALTVTGASRTLYSVLGNITSSSASSTGWHITLTGSTTAGTLSVYAAGAFQYEK